MARASPRPGHVSAADVVGFGEIQRSSAHASSSELQMRLPASQNRGLAQNPVGPSCSERVDAVQLRRSDDPVSRQRERLLLEKADKRTRSYRKHGKAASYVTNPQRLEGKRLLHAEPGLVPADVNKKNMALTRPQTVHERDRRTRLRRRVGRGCKEDEDRQHDDLGKPRPAPTHLMRGSEQLQSSPNDGSENKVGFFGDTDRLPDSASQKQVAGHDVVRSALSALLPNGKPSPSSEQLPFPIREPIQIAGDGRPNRFIRDGIQPCRKTLLRMTLRRRG